jgi:hypothetical protein
MRKSMQDKKYGIAWGKNRLRDLDFADDLAFIGDSPEILQQMTDDLSDIAGKIGLKISSEKN